MNRKTLFALWGGLFILCAGLGFIPEPSGALSLGLTALSVVFFLPPALLVWQGHQGHDRRLLALVRNLSIASLSGSVLLIIANFLAAFRSELLGDILHGLLVVVSSPMICGGQCAMSLFLWACLLIASLKT